jgi:hypothetical protein
MGWSGCTTPSHRLEDRFDPAAEEPMQSSVLDRELERDREPSGPRIRCPLCGSSPRKEDKWFCTCGYEWNTFDTGGVCPACLHPWTETQCLACSRWSAHSDWDAD